MFVPLGMDELGTSAEFADAAAGSPPDPGVWAGDDDLSAFDPVTLFLDPHLLDETVYDLLDDASQYTVLSANPIQLTGIHSLIGVDEVAMISIPDAAHLGWTSSRAGARAAATASACAAPAARRLVLLSGPAPRPHPPPWSAGSRRPADRPRGERRSPSPGPTCRTAPSPSAPRPRPARRVPARRARPSRRPALAPST